MVRPRHQPGGLCLLLLLLCQFMEDRSAQGKRGGDALGGQGFVLFGRLHWVCSEQRCSRKMLDQLSESGMERSGKTKGSDTLGPEAEFGARRLRRTTLSCPPFGTRRCRGAGESSPGRFRKIAVAAGVLWVWRIAKRPVGRAAPRGRAGQRRAGPAGNCWLRQAKNGRCQVLYKTELTKEECCSTGRLSTSWTEEDVNDNTLFKWMIFNGGAPNCIPCKETCENVDCGPGKKCRMNKKNKPRCVCAPDCSNITWKGPVCGLDGKTYRNECALLKARCKEQPELEVQYQGKCKKTCRDVFCPGSSTCVVDQTNNAYCVTCNRICPEPTSSEQYLCGNDGVTYSSACHLRKATCLLGRSIGLAYEGKCIKAKSCEDIQCTGGKKCLWDFKVGRGRCSLCDELCPESKSEEPVCASDNATYASECAMKEAACSSGVLLEVKHSGSC
ncbi:hypothetical protein EI555_009368, partial [Monodon monoceros]